MQLQDIKMWRKDFDKGVKQDAKRRVNKLRQGLHLENRSGNTIEDVASRVYGRQLQKESIKGHKTPKRK